MVTKKYYKKHKKFDIVIPSWFSDMNMKRFLKSKVSKYYPNIIIKEKNGDKIILFEDDEKDNTLTFRCDIFPVPNKLMIQIMRNSVNDILLTGDQSITDALSCCDTKNIFYQIAPWKSDLGRQLAKEMPNKYLKSVKTSCGTLNAIRYKSKYTKFVRDWDFRTRSKDKLDAIILSAIALKNDKDISSLEKIVSSSKTVSVIKKRLKKMLK